ncbi:hypothetical protein TeGR_g14607 [Tetraparma gracilis]|uniref:Chromo domain-containing protein n=1 Tax=Tetraparma gracilis TaxID=2962635 RepID=A0ABQ6MRT8_9STRA|nr:hypothetical protein TeGR_g14607 [Tetraparma gracilis]
MSSLSPPKQLRDYRDFELGAEFIMRVDADPDEFRQGKHPGVEYFLSQFLDELERVAAVDGYDKVHEPLSRHAEFMETLVELCLRYGGAGALARGILRELLRVDERQDLQSALDGFVDNAAFPLKDRKVLKADIAHAAVAAALLQKAEKPRGRPPKGKAPEADEGATEQPKAGKPRPPGRPPKGKVWDEAAGAWASEADAGAAGEGGGWGGKAAGGGGGGGGKEDKPRPPGRPPKGKVWDAAAGAWAPEAGAGAAEPRKPAPKKPAPKKPAPGGGAGALGCSKCRFDERGCGRCRGESDAHMCDAGAAGGSGEGGSKKPRAGAAEPPKSAKKARKLPRGLYEVEWIRLARTAGGEKVYTTKWRGWEDEGDLTEEPEGKLREWMSDRQFAEAIRDAPVGGGAGGEEEVKKKKAGAKRR